ncbi:ISAon1 family transposase N-terminal region protein [Parabacteroides distasonis]|uniref:ISAon1 family transposase N-terminal region protein n=2 Tax=Tannerellaceae TaxID=2005525 RepID=UPI001E4ED534|nr:hypothetical protein [Parabacteroides distasonis]
MWERMFDLVLGLKKEHRLMMVITLIYAVTLFGITVDVEAMENWLQLVGYTIRTLCIACIIQLSVFFLTNIFWKELNRGLNKTFVVISGNVLSLAFLLFPFSISYIDMTAESMKLSSLNTERNRIDSMVRYYENLKSLDSSSPDKSGGKFFNSIENLHLCTMNNQGLLALAQLILPSEILSNFEVVRVEEEASLIRIYLDESVKAEYKENPEIESKGFCEAVTIRDFPIRDKGVDLIVRRRKWYDKQNNRYFSDSYDLKAEETRYSKEFAAFLKGVYGDDSYDLPFA